MDIEFRKVDLDKDFSKCLEFRKDSHICSFDTESGFLESVKNYREKISERLSEKEWFYIHLWKNTKIVGQLEFRSFSRKQGIGYIHLFYLIKSLRGTGASDLIHKYVVSELSMRGCRGAVLSVSRTNNRAIAFYKRLGWEYLASNPKHDVTDFYRLWFN